MTRWLHRGKRWLYLIHRWIGIGTCLLLAMWFCSGMVMMYVPYPSLTAAERTDGLAEIDWTSIEMLPPSHLRADGFGHPRALLLEEGLSGPVWRIRTDEGEATVSARGGGAVAATGELAAARIAARFARAGVRTVALVERDQWTVAGGFDRFRPLWKVAMDTPDDRILYVASTTGAVVQDTRGMERFWNWLGAVPHWLYPTILRKDQAMWRQVVLWTAGAGIVGAVSGVWIGILRARFRRRYRGGRITPYRGWQWWHHVLGLAGGTLLTTWIVSGWLSVDPGRWFASAGLADAARAAYAGAPMPAALDWARLRDRPAAQGAKRLRLIAAAGRALIVLDGPSGDSVLDAASLRPVRPDPATLARRAARLVPGYRIAGIERLDRADSYWYEAKGAVELPVLRVRFDDPAGTWVHLSLRTGEVLGDIDARGRLYRWLYDGLHRWDLQGLITRRPLWDVWMWLWCVAGLVVSVSGVVLGWRRLMPQRRAHHVAA